MSTLGIHRVFDDPTGVDISPSAVYFKDVSEWEEGDAGAHKAWRLIDMQTTKPSSYISGVTLVGADMTGAVYFTNLGVTASSMFSSVSGIEIAPPTPDKYIGAILSTPTTVTALDVQLPANAGAGFFDRFTVEYSDDTTDGSDGTWVAVGSIDGTPRLIISDSRSFPLGKIPKADILVSNQLGDAVYPLISHAEVDAIVDASRTTTSHIIEVDDLAARDALSLSSMKHVKVLDATADPLVSSGSATYTYHPGTQSFVITRGAALGTPIQTEDW